MIAHSAIGKGWHDKADAVEAYMLSTQDPMQITYRDEEGHTDDSAGATMSVSNFYALVDQDLAAGQKQY